MSNNSFAEPSTYEGIKWRCLMHCIYTCVVSTIPVPVTNSKQASAHFLNVSIGKMKKIK